MPAANKEEAFAELVSGYENEWVAIIEIKGEEFVVGHGPTAVQAANQATEKGYSQALLFKVPSFSASCASAREV
jgi:heterodisulfide reductase subunit A-like polyferredoxin